MNQPAATLPQGQRLTFAHLASLCLGLALVAWSIVPTAIERSVSGNMPPTSTIATGVVALCVGCFYIWLHPRLRSGERWALWCSFGGGLVILNGVIASVAFQTAIRPGLFAIVLASATVVATWLALTAKPDRISPYRNQS